MPFKLPSPRLPAIELPAVVSRLVGQLRRTSRLGTVVALLLPMSVLLSPAGMTPAADAGVFARIASAAGGPAAVASLPSTAAGSRAGRTLHPDRGSRAAEDDWGDFPPTEPPLVALPEQDGSATEQQPAAEPVDTPDSPVGQLLIALGISFGDHIDVDDVQSAADILGVGVGGNIDDQDVQRLIHAHRQRLSPFIQRLGFKHGTQVVEDDVRRFADKTGVGIGEVVDPLDVERVRRELVRVIGEREPTKVFASLDGVHLHVPSRHLKLIGFHEAAYGVARQLRPHDGNARMMTLPTRNRPTGSRSAADVSVQSGAPVLSPVSGTVVGVEHYALYGKYPDSRIRIVSSQNPSMLVSVLHVTGPRVKVGDEVQGGRTVIAKSGTLFPFASQIDRFAGRAPHVHVEVRRR